jgi:hypothetical protein
MLHAIAKAYFSGILMEIRVIVSLGKGLYEDILRRLIDGMVELGECGCSTWAIPLSYGDMHMLRKNFNAYQEIGADRTEGCGGLLTGSLRLCPIM